MTRPKVGALFAGYGGLELAVREVFPAASPAWVAEFDAAPSRILAQRFPGVPNLGDVTAVDWAALEPVDIITGGSPCQDLSHAGKRAGMRTGTRSGLWASMCDAIEIIRPRLVVWENVRGALSAEADSAVEPCPICVGDGGRVSLRALGRVLGDLAELGYDAAWTSLRAADVGAPHGRFRVFVLAWPADAQSPRLEARREGRRGGGGAADAESDPWWLDDRDGGAAAGVGGRAADLTLLRTPTAQLAVNGGSQHPEKRKAGGHGPTLADEVEHILPTPRVSMSHGAGDLTNRRASTRLESAVLLPTPRATDGTKGGPNQRGSSGDLMLPSAVTLLPTPTAGDSKMARNSTAERHRTPPTGVHGGDTLTDAVVPTHGLSRDFGAYAPAVARWEAVLGRPAPAPTEPTGKGGAHRLSPRFVEWLMGLPVGWVTGESVEAWRGRLADRRAGLDARPVGHRGSVARRLPVATRNEQLKALGNGVVPQQAAAAIRHLLTVRAAALAGQAVAA